MSTLDAALLAAHAAQDHPALVTLYARAAAQTADADAACFYLTHAMVFALELGDPRSEVFRAALVAQGREEAL